MSVTTLGDTRTILEKVIDVRNGHYVHALEVNSIDEIKDSIERITEQYNTHDKEDVKDFFSSMSIYYIGDDMEIESEVNNFDVDDYIDYL